MTTKKFIRILTEIIEDSGLFMVDEKDKNELIIVGKDDTELFLLTILKI